MSQGSQGRIKETREGSSLPRMAGMAARGGAKTAWHMSTSDPPSSSSFPHGLWQAAREPLGPVRGGQPSDNSLPAWPLPCLTPCRRQSPHSQQPHWRCRHTNDMHNVRAQTETEGQSVKICLWVIQIWQKIKDSRLKDNFLKDWTVCWDVWLLMKPLDNLSFWANSKLDHSSMWAVFVELV